MTAFDNAVDLLIKNMLSQNTRLTLNGKFEIKALVDAAITRCPKLAFIYKSCSYCQSNDRMQICFIPVKYNYTTEIDIEYESPYRGFELRNVVDDTGDFDIMAYLKKYKQQYGAYPVYIPIVSSDTEGIWEAVNNNLVMLYGEFQGLEEISGTVYSEQAMLLIFSYKYDAGQLYSMEISADNAARKLVMTLFGSGNIPAFLKVYLVFSYIQQNCKYCSMYSEAMKRGLKGIDIAPELAFGVLCSREKQAVSKGIASAFTLILKKTGIECITVKGELLEENSDDEYFWNMVKLNGVWYHLDASWSIDNDGINISGFMRSDSMFFNKYRWYEGTPEAKGCTFNYDYIEEYINDNFEKLTADGIDEKYLVPCEIYA